METSVELITVPGLATAPYPYAAVVRDASNVIFTAGACPLDEYGHTVAVGDVAGQAEQVMVNLQAALLAAGADLTDVVKTTVYVASATRDDLGRGPPPLWRPSGPEHVARGRHARLSRATR